MYTGEHAMIFGEKNTWTDWYLIPASRPVLAPPSVKTQYLDIPGASGSIDLTESLTGYPVYNDREGSFEFYVDNDHMDWQQLYSGISDYLHGRRMNLYLADDPDYYYTGRFAVNEWRSESSNSKITIDYRAGPYKWAITETQVISLTTTSSMKTGTIPATAFNAPVNPRIAVSTSVPQGMTVRFTNPYLHINEEMLLTGGTYTPPQCICFGAACTMRFTGAGSVKVYVRKGGL